jgi:hypothetical protein
MWALATDVLGGYPDVAESIDALRHDGADRLMEMSGRPVLSTADGDGGMR